jgi:Transposase IS66 family
MVKVMGSRLVGQDLTEAAGRWKGLGSSSGALPGAWCPPLLRLDETAGSAGPGHRPSIPRIGAAKHSFGHLAGFAGILQADAYGGCNRLCEPDRKPGPVLAAACWAHLGAGRARRREHEHGQHHRLSLCLIIEERHGWLRLFLRWLLGLGAKLAELASDSRDQPCEVRRSYSVIRDVR